MTMLIDYWGIQEEIAEILRASLDGFTVTVEEEIQFSPEQVPWVGIYLDRRDAPEGQPIAAGKRLRYQIRYLVWVYHYSLSKPESMRLRDRALGEVESVLLSNRTLNEKVDQSWIEGGDMVNALKAGQSQDFLSGGEIVLVAEVVSTAA